VVRLFDEHKNWIGQIKFARMHLASLSIHTRFIQTTKKCSNNHLLITLINLI
jgi:hypothetical protein